MVFKVFPHSHAPDTLQLGLGLKQVTWQRLAILKRPEVKGQRGFQIIFSDWLPLTFSEMNYSLYLPAYTPPPPLWTAQCWTNDSKTEIKLNSRSRREQAESGGAAADCSSPHVSSDVHSFLLLLVFQCCHETSTFSMLLMNWVNFLSLYVLHEGSTSVTWPTFAVVIISC